FSSPSLSTETNSTKPFFISSSSSLSLPSLKTVRTSRHSRTDWRPPATLYLTYPDSYRSRLDWDPDPQEIPTMSSLPEVSSEYQRYASRTW
ncbi:unnamed protein product, partial [Linum tenue]